MTVSFARTIILYLLVVIALRVMGKRQMGELSPAEFVITLLVSELAAIPMQDISTPLIYGIMPIFTLLALEIIISTIFMRSRRIRKIFAGRTSILIENGKINQDEMTRLRLTLDELLEELRLKSFMDISMVKYAILEANGELSVFPFSKNESLTRGDVGLDADTSSLPYTIICDGVYIKNEVRKLGRDEKWVKNELSKHNLYSFNDVFLMQLDELGNVFVIPKEKKK